MVDADLPTPPSPITTILQVRATWERETSVTGSVVNQVPQATSGTSLEPLSPTKAEQKTKSKKQSDKQSKRRPCQTEWKRERNAHLHHTAKDNKIS
jgi:hypothetical protein